MGFPLYFLYMKVNSGDEIESKLGVNIRVNV